MYKDLFTTDSYSKSFTTLCTSTSYYILSVRCLHTTSKPMGFFTTFTTWLIRSFHDLLHLKGKNNLLLSIYTFLFLRQLLRLKISKPASFSDLMRNKTTYFFLRQYVEFLSRPCYLTPTYPHIHKSGGIFGSKYKSVFVCNLVVR